MANTTGYTLATYRVFDIHPHHGRGSLSVSSVMFPSHKVGETSLAFIQNSGELRIGESEGHCELRSIAPQSVPNSVTQDPPKIFIEAWQTVARDTASVNAGTAVQHSFNVPGSTKILIEYLRPDTLSTDEIGLQTSCLAVGAFDICVTCNGVFAAGRCPYDCGARMLSEDGRRMREGAVFTPLL